MKAFVERRLTRETQLLLLIFCLVVLLYTFSSLLFESHLGFWPQELLEYFAGSALLMEPPLPWNEVIFHLHFRLFLELIVLLLLFGVLAAGGGSRVHFYLFFLCGLLLFLELLTVVGLRWSLAYGFAMAKQGLFLGSRLLLLGLALRMALPLLRRRSPL